MKLKRFMAISMAAVMTMSLTACGGGSGDESLAGCLLISGGAVHLPGQVKTRHDLALQCGVKLCGVEEVVFYCVSGTVQLGIFESGYCSQSFHLYVEWHRR